MESYAFDRPFRLKLLALCLQDDWMNRYGNFIIMPNYFEMEDEEAIAKAIMNYRERFGRSPIDPSDLVELIESDQDLRKLVKQVYLGKEQWDLDLASQLAIQFAKRQAAKLAIIDSIDDINKDDMEAVIQRMQSALAVGEQLDIPWLDPIGDVDKWLYDSWDNKASTGLLHVDQVLEGGLGIGSEEGIILGPMNRGKTMMLVNIGFGGASIGSGLNVAHFTHEMSAELICKRYAARMVFRFPKKGDDLEQFAEELALKARKLLKGKIRVIDARGYTHIDVQHKLDRLHAEEFYPEIIISDYVDKIPPIQRRSDRRFELSELHEWYRGLARKYQAAMWTASQSGRDSFSKEIIGMEDIAEDIGKAAISDVIVAVCQTREEEKADQCRLYMAKVRDGESHAMIAARYYKKQQAVVTSGYVVSKSKDQEV